MSQAAEPTPSSSQLVHVCDMSVRWGDMDALQHVNNSMYLVYLQEARLDWIHAMADTNNDGAMRTSLVATSEITYHRPIVWPATVRIEIYCERIGNSSATLGYRLVNANDVDCLYAVCRTVMVWVDPKTHRPCSIPAQLRASLQGES